MNNYEVLGVGKNSSLEEIKSAYENKVKDIDRQVTNEKNAEAFKKVLRDAYDGILSNKVELSESGQAPDRTTVMPIEEIKELLESNENDPEEDDYDYYEERPVGKKTKKKRKSSSSIGSKKKSKGKDDQDKEKSKNRARKKDAEKDLRKHNNKHYHEESSGLSGILLIPFKILALPVIILLSAIILILDLISVAVWIVSKVLLIASIAVASIYGYQVYTGSASMRYDLFAACGAVFVIALLIPLIVKVFRAPLKIINNSLKDFVF